MQNKRFAGKDVYSPGVPSALLHTAIFHVYIIIDFRGRCTAFYGTPKKVLCLQTEDSFDFVFSLWRQRKIAGAQARLCSAVAEAVAAVDRAIVAGLKGHLAGLAALGAHSVIHLAGSTVGTGDAFAGIAAGFAALGLIGEALLGVKLLLTGGENEFLSAILADQGLVSVHEIPL